MIVLGIDAATRTGWAIVEAPPRGRPAVRSWGACPATAPRVADIVEQAVRAGVHLAVLETPFLDKNPDTTIKLAIVCGRFVQELERAGIAWESHKAAEWQRRLLTGLIGPADGRERRKWAARLYVLNEFGIRASEDGADAICMTVWRAKEGMLSPRAPGR